MTLLRSLLAVSVIGLVTLLTSRAAQGKKDMGVKAPGGKQVAVANKTVIEVRDAESKKLLWQAKLTDLQIEIVLPGAGGTKRHPRALTATVPRGTGNIQVLAYTPDGKRLASADRAGTLLLDSATGQFVWSVNTPPGVNQLLFSSDGKTLTAKAPGVRDLVFDVATGKRLE